ncbi:MAG: helix-turn-helix domain-containing protein [Desulfurococcaceae archaeon]|jgi:DNA-binding transcriptional ArsR family regulator
MEEQGFCGIYDIRFLVKRGIIITPPTLKTLDAVITLKRATADDVANYTGRARTIESRYLAKLNKLGIVAKIKEGRKIYYMEPIYAVQQHYSLYGDSISPEQLAHMISLPADIVRMILNILKSKK